MATAEANKANPVYGLGRSVATKHLLLNGKPCVDAEKLFRLAAGLERPSSLDAISSALRAKSLEKAAQARRRNVTTKEEVGKAVDVAANVTGGILQIGCAAFFLIIIAAWGVQLIMGRDLQLLGWFLVGGVILAIALLLKKSGVFDALSSGTDLTNIVREQVLAFGEARDRIQQEIAQRLRTELGSVVQQQIALQKKISVNRANPDPGAKLLAEQDEVALSLLRHQTSSAAEAVDYGARDGYEEFAEAVMPLYYAAISAAGRRKEVIRGSEPGYKDTQDEVERIEAEITTMRLIQTSGANDAEIERLRARQDEIRRRAESRLRPSGTPQASRQLDAWLRELDGLERAILDHCGFTSDAKESAIVRWRTLGDQIARDRTPKGTGAPTTVAEKTASMQVNPFYALVLIAVAVVVYGFYRSRQPAPPAPAAPVAQKPAPAAPVATPVPLPAAFTSSLGTFEHQADGWVLHGTNGDRPFLEAGADATNLRLIEPGRRDYIWFLPIAGGLIHYEEKGRPGWTPSKIEVKPVANLADLAPTPSTPAAEPTAAAPVTDAAVVDPLPTVAIPVPTEVAPVVPTAVPATAVPTVQAAIPTPTMEPGAKAFKVRPTRELDTGIDVPAGATLHITATGEVCYVKRKASDKGPCYPPDGTKRFNTAMGAVRAVIQPPGGMKNLIQSFRVGSNFRGKSPSSGRLVLFVESFVGSRDADMTGTFHVTVAVR